MAIIQVCGKPRAGKTSFVVAKIINEYMTYQNENYHSACRYIKNQNKARGINRALPPERHVVSADFAIYRRYPNMQSYPISGWEFANKNLLWQTKAKIPYGVYAFDECQRYWDSKVEGKLPPWVTRPFEVHGHIFLTIFLITQRYMRLHPDIRELCSEFIYIDKSIHTYLVNGHKVKSDKFLSYGQLIKTVWTGRVFTDGDDMDKYAKGDKLLGSPFKYEFNGDIRSHYNPYGFADEIDDILNDFNYVSIIQKERPTDWFGWKKKLEELNKKQNGGKYG